MRESENEIIFWGEIYYYYPKLISLYFCLNGTIVTTSITDRE